MTSRPTDTPNTSETHLYESDNLLKQTLPEPYSIPSGITTSIARGKTQIWAEDPIVEGDSITYGATVEFPDGTSDRLLNRIPLRFAGYVSESCDAFLLGALLRAAEFRADLHVRGQVSPTLLKNLVEFQNAFGMWYQDSFNRLEIFGDKEQEDEPSPDAVICAFSGGFDSGFSVYRNKVDPHRSRFSYNIEAGLLIQGIEIPLNDDAALATLGRRYESLLNGIGVELITLKSNMRDFNRDWMVSQGIALASSLTLFKKRFSAGIISSSDDYNHLVIPWGASPVTDHLTSSDSFAIKHDGSGFTRTEKIKALSNWKELYDQIRVCFLDPDHTGNCGRCYKCTVAWLCVHLSNSPLPASLPVPRPESILQIRHTSAPSITRLQRLYDLPNWKSVPEDIRKAVERTVTFNRRQRFLERQMPGDKYKAARVFLSKVHRHLGINFA